MKAWKILARHKWLIGCIITESHNEAKSDIKPYRRFTATVRGWQNFVIYEGYLYDGITNTIIEKVKKIREKIDSGDESVFE